MKGSGVTLIELLITFTIITILVVIGVPQFTQLLKNNRLEARSQELYHALQYARSEAIKQNKTVYITFKTGDQWCYGINAETSCNCTIADNCTLGTYAADQAQYLNLTTSGLTGNTLQFDGVRGTSQSSSKITFNLYNQTTAMSVTVGAIGNLQICSSNIRGYSSCS